MIVGARKERVREKSRDRHDSSTSRLIKLCTLLGFACDLEKSFRKEKRKKKGRKSNVEGGREKKYGKRERERECRVSRKEKEKKKVFSVFIVWMCVVCLSRASIKRWIL